MSANEQDVVLAFRQEVEEQIRRAQENCVTPVEIFAVDDSLSDSLRKLAARHESLQSEVALLRTIVLKLISEPVDSTSK